MLQWFTEMAQALGQSPWAQGALAAFSTLILEDPTTVGAGLLVAQGKMAWITAFLGLTIGIAGGDFGLYLLGRYAHGPVVRWGIVRQERLDNAAQWFHRNVVLAVVASRFVPGMRLPTYISAGVLKVSPIKFLLVAISASIVWTLLLLTLSVRLGEGILQQMGPWKLPLGIAIVLLIAGSQYLAARWRKRALNKMPPAPPVTSFFEFWPPWLFYLPVLVQVGRLALKHRHLSLPALANPSIYMSGFIGESKSEILKLVPERQKDWVAPWIAWPQGGAVSDIHRKLILAQLNQVGADFPLVAKPDVGQRGAGVQVIRTAEELWDYIEAFPEDDAVILQQKVPYEREAGVFYYRYPNEDKGHLLSITLKKFPKVTGDGQHRLRELILKDPRARKLQKLYFGRLQDRLEEIPAKGEVIPLVFAGNHCQGAIFENGWHLKTDALRQRIDEIARSMDGFYFGRFDIRYDTDEGLRAGERFQIVEVNGASSEATHIWDARCTLREAYRVLFEQFTILYRIGATNHQLGTPLFPVSQVLREWLRYLLRRKNYPETH